MATLCSRPSLELAFDLACLEDLEDVALLDVLIALERDAALVALGDLAHVVLEALERADPTGPDDRAVAHQPHRRTAADGAARDVAAGDRPHARRAERLAHLGGTD